jgi:hypothetical protein
MLVVPPASMADAKQPRELNRTGVYVLIGPPIKLVIHPKRCVLDDGNGPTQPTRSEADVADAQGLFLTGCGAEAEGVETPEGFVVVAAGMAAASEAESCHGYIREPRVALINSVLKSEGEKYVFTQDYVFTSHRPPPASSSDDPRTAVRKSETKDGTALKTSQERSLS